MKWLAITFQLCFALLYSCSPFVEVTGPTTASSSIQKDVHKGMFSLIGPYSFDTGGATDFLASMGHLGKNKNIYGSTPAAFSGISRAIPILRIKPSVVPQLNLVFQPSVVRHIPNTPSMRTPYETQVFAGPLHAHLDSMSHATLTSRPLPFSSMLPSRRIKLATED